MKQPRLLTSVGACRRIGALSSAIKFVTLLWAALTPNTTKAQLPAKHYAVAYLPSAIEGLGLRIDDTGNVFGTTLKLPTEFLIFHPTNGTVQHISSPLVPNTRRFDLVDINQKGQFITTQNTRDYGHQFVWTGGAFVELQPPPPHSAPMDIPGFPGTWYFSDIVHPTSIHNDGSIWGTVDETLTPQGAVSSLGAEVLWDLRGNPTVTLNFSSANYFLRTGSRRNEKGSFLRYDPTSGLLVVNAGYWDGQSASLGTKIPHPLSTVISLNDLDEVAGINAATHVVWIYLPVANYGLAAGLHTLSGVVASVTATSLPFNNAGQIFVSTSDPAQPRAVWDKGVWQEVKVDDPTNLGLEFQGMNDSNAKGAILATVGLSTQPTAWRQAVLTPKSDLAVVSDVIPRQIPLDDEFDLTLEIRNDGSVPLSKVGILVSSLAFSGAIVGDWIKAPPSLLPLAPGASGTLHYVFRAKAPGKSQLRFQVQGFDAAGQRQGLTALLFSPQFRVLPAEQGDLLVKRDVESVSQFGLNDVYQTSASGGQVRTNAVGRHELSQFQVQIQNDGKKTSTFRLNAVEATNSGWDVKYLLNGEDISAGVRTFLGTTLPPLATNQTYLVTVQMTPTNAAPGSDFRTTFALANTNNPPDTMDVVSAVSATALEITVNSTGDLPDKDPKDCCCDTGQKLKDGSVECTLRAAIEFANKHVGKDIIKFKIPSDDPNYDSGVPLIQPRNGLPVITDPVRIDGGSQDTAAATPPIELNGSLIRGPNIPPIQFDDTGATGEVWKSNPDAANGLLIRANDSQITGLVVNQFPLFGIRVESDHCVVQGCFLGTDHTGTRSKANGVQVGFNTTYASVNEGKPPPGYTGGGIVVHGTGNRIGGSNPSQRNLISGVDNGYRTYSGDSMTDPLVAGIGILIGSGSGNTVEGNLVGTDFTGLRLIQTSTTDRPAGSAIGIYANGADSFVGGSIGGAGNTTVGNMIGIFVAGSGNRLRGNRVGLNQNGRAIVGSRAASAGNGIGILGEGKDMLVGGPEPGAGNIVGNNGASLNSYSEYSGAIILKGGNGNIEGNLVGVEIDGQTPARNSSWGILVEVPPDGALQIQHNIISYNLAPIEVGFSSGRNAGEFVPVIRGNHIFANYVGSEAGGIVLQGDKIFSATISENEMDGNIALAAITPFGSSGGFGGLPSPRSNGALLNDDGDRDTGPNEGQNYPDINSSRLFHPTGGPGGLTALAALDTTPGINSYRIEFFASHASTAWGYGPGERFLGGMTVITDINGRAGIQFSTTSPVSPGEFLTATATDFRGFTSEFSKPVMIHGSQSTFPQKNLSDAVQRQVPNGTGSVHSFNAGVRGNVQLQGASPQGAQATGDGNGDGIQDYLQVNVVSFPGISGKWITLGSPIGTALENVSPSGPPDFANIPAGYSFPLGFVSFTITGLARGGSVVVTNFFHDDIDCDTVFAYGPTPDNPTPHWYEFLFDGDTGAQFDLNGFTLTLLDGDVGDHALQGDGEITTTLAAACKIPPAPQLRLLNTTVTAATRISFNPTPNGRFTIITNAVPIVTSVLAWPAGAIGYALQFTDNLSATNSWRTDFNPPAVRDNQNVLTNVAASTARYYRLRKF